MLSLFLDRIGKSDAIFESREEYIVRFFRAMTFYHPRARLRRDAADETAQHRPARPRSTHGRECQAPAGSRRSGAHHGTSPTASRGSASRVSSAADTAKMAANALVRGLLFQDGKRLRQVHIKDAKRTKKTGEWGEEVPVGTGEVDWKEFFDTLDELKFAGFCCIEREAGNQRVVDIKTAREFVSKLPV